MGRAQLKLNPLLPLLMASIYDSGAIHLRAALAAPAALAALAIQSLPLHVHPAAETIRHQVKLYMAIRLNDHRKVNTLMRMQGIAIKRNSPTELVGDARLVVWAAYHDHGPCVDVMLENGFEESQLDQLIMLEIGRPAPPSGFGRPETFSGPPRHDIVNS